MIKTGYVQGIDATLLPATEALEALSERSVRETRVRVRTALAESGVEDVSELMLAYRWGAKSVREYSSSQFDLAIAMQVANVKDDGVAIGELSLNGDVRSVRGIVPILLAARREGIQRVLIPAEQWHEAQIVGGMNLVPVRNLQQLIEGTTEAEPPTVDPVRFTRSYSPELSTLPMHLMDAFNEVSLAARGGKHVLLVGSPGSGKTMIARRIPPQFSPMDDVEWTAVAAIRSAAGLGRDWHTHPIHRPFRAPHHTASEVAMVGTRSGPLRPGELTLAHLGVLFLDELSNFPMRTLHSIAHCIAKGKTYGDRYGRGIMPAKPVVIAAMNPCPCGFYAHPKRDCRCPDDKIKRYAKRTNWFIEALDMTVISLISHDAKSTGT